MPEFETACIWHPLILAAYRPPELRGVSYGIKSAQVHSENERGPEFLYGFNKGPNLPTGRLFLSLQLVNQVSLLLA